MNKISNTIEDPKTSRLFFLDWLRVLAFAYLILFHTGMMFVSWGFHIESGHDSQFLKYIMDLTHIWRIALLFMVSGVAISYMTRKIPIKSFSKERAVRLFIPLLFATIVVVAPQSYFEALQKGFIEEGFIAFFLNDYFSFTWIDGMLGPMPVYNHMWYVLYLFVYTMLLLPVFYFFNSEKGTSMLGGLENWLVKGRRIIWAPMLLFAITKNILWPSFPETHAMIDDWWIHADSIIILMIGFTFVRMPKTWAALQSHRMILLGLSLVSYAALMAVYYVPNEYLPADGNVLYPFVTPVVKWSWIAMLTGMARHYLNNGSNVLNYLNKAVYPFFILHQTVIIILGFYAIDWGMGMAGEFWTIALGTYVICWILYEGIIRHFAFTRLVFGMRARDPVPIKIPETQAAE